MMSYQFTALLPTPNGMILGHDMSREFNYFMYSENMDKGENLFFEPTQNFEVLYTYKDIWDQLEHQNKTDGFVMDLKKHPKGGYYMLHTTGRDFAKVFYSENGLKWNVALKIPKESMGFGAQIFFDEEDIYIKKQIGDGNTDNLKYLVLK
ncbi:hypothetical protein [Myroides odoratimimus]|nr:hypothetical protein [Myroides odoratimimus]